MLKGLLVNLVAAGTTAVMAGAEAGEGPLEAEIQQLHRTAKCRFLRLVKGLDRPCQGDVFGCRLIDWNCDIWLLAA
jgi:hypothetical protein